MEKETDNMEEDFNIDELLAEDEDSPAGEDIKEEAPATKRKSRGRPKGIPNKVSEPEVPAEITATEKDLLNMEWQSVAQAAYDGYQNIKTGELIDSKEAIRRCLCYAQEAAKNTR